MVDLFKCEIFDCKLTPRACGLRYAKGNEDATWRNSTQAYYICSGCKVGAENVKLIHASELTKPKRAGFGNRGALHAGSR